MVEQEGTEIVSRKVGAALGIGILLLPFVFAWFTLRKGYGKLARGASLSWMLLVLILGIGANQHPSNPADSQVDQSTATEAGTSEADTSAGDQGDDSSATSATVAISDDDKRKIIRYGTCSSINKAIIVNIKHSGADQDLIESIVSAKAHQAAIYTILYAETYNKYSKELQKEMLELGNAFMNKNIMGKSLNGRDLVEMEKSECPDFPAEEAHRIMENQSDDYNRTLDDYQKLDI